MLVTVYSKKIKDIHEEEITWGELIREDRYYFKVHTKSGLFSKKKYIYLKRGQNNKVEEL